MGEVCCCCKNREKENKPNEEEKEKEKIQEGPAIENTSSQTKANTIKSIEVETLGNNEKEGVAIPENEKVPESIAPIKLLSMNNVEEIRSCKEFFIKIFIETLEITYKLCDDFGNFFKPFVEVVFDNQNKVLNTMDEEKLNLSNISENADVNISYNANIPIGHKKSGMNSAILPKERFYYFKSSVDFNGNDETRFSSLTFYVKNENTHGHLKILPAIIIGQIRIPISLILNQKDKSFDGYLSLKLRDLIEIGQLKVKIHCGSDLNLNNSISILASEGNNLAKDNFNLLRNSEIEDVLFI